MQRASNFAVFFEKLVKFLLRLTDALPEYEQIVDLCRDTQSVRM